MQRKKLSLWKRFKERRKLYRERNNTRYNNTRSLRILLELRMMKVVVTTAPTRCAKIQPNCHQQQTNTQIFTSQTPLYGQTSSVKALKGKSFKFHGQQ